MSNETLIARVKNFEELINAEAAIPVKAVRKLYKMTMELVNLLAMTESYLADAKTAIIENAEPAPLRYHNPHANQMKEMAAEMDVLRKELAELKLVTPVTPSRPKTKVKSAWDHKETIVTKSNPLHKDISYTPKKKK